MLARVRTTMLRRRHHSPWRPSGVPSEPKSPVVSCGAARIEALGRRRQRAARLAGDASSGTVASTSRRPEIVASAGPDSTLRPDWRVRHFFREFDALTSHVAALPGGRTRAAAQFVGGRPGRGRKARNARTRTTELLGAEVVIAVGKLAGKIIGVIVAGQNRRFAGQAAMRLGNVAARARLKKLRAAAGEARVRWERGGSGRRLAGQSSSMLRRGRAKYPQ